MGNFKIIAYICLLLLLFSCKKDEKDDTLNKQTLNGMVYNNCTDSGLAGIKVYFETFKDNSKISSYETMSGVNGNFSFTDVDIHSNSKYTYAIYIPSISGIGANKPELTRFDGTTMYFSRDEASTFFKPRITPGFYNLCFVIKPNTYINYPDSVNCKFQQNIFHNNVSTLPYKLEITQFYLQNGYVYCFANYPMGLWHLTIDKWKTNVLSTINDSIYIGYTDTKTYTINW
jgi:hypothetical protein